MELRHLRYFVVAAQEENLHRAAERLHIAQSSLSRHVKDLEIELDVQLFERHGRRIRLSTLGHIYLEKVSGILELLQESNEAIKHHEASLRGKLRISLHYATVRRPMVPRYLQMFRSRNPGVALELSQMLAPSQLDALRAKKIDAAFTLYRRPDDSIELDHWPIASDMFVLALPKTHRLAKRKHLRLADLKDESFLWFQRSINPEFHDQLIKECRAGGLIPKVVQSLLTHEMNPELVAAGMGLAFVPASASNHNRKIALRKVSDFNISLQLDLVWRRDNRTPELERFIRMIVDNHPVGSKSPNNAASVEAG